MPRAESPVHREASATSALPPCTALPAVAASALPACGARLRTAGADGASRGAGADLSRGTLPAAGSQAQPLARLRSGASPRAPPKLPRQPAHALPPRRGKTCSRSLRAAGTGRRAACLPPPPRPGSPARGSLAEAPALHRRAAPRHAVPCRARGSALPARAPVPVPGWRYERRRGEGVSGPQGDPAALRGRRGGAGRRGGLERSVFAPSRGCPALGPPRRAAGRRWLEGRSGQRLRRACLARGAAARRAGPRPAPRRGALPAHGGAPRAGVGAAGRGAGGGAAARRPAAGRLRGRPGGRACPPSAAWGGSELGRPQGKGPPGPRCRGVQAGGVLRVFSGFSSVWEKDKTHNCSVRFCLASSQVTCR